MRAAVKRLSFGTAEERREAAAEVARLARSDERTKRLLPELGVVPPLVSMLEDGYGASVSAAEALHELARGTHRNKVHIVKAGLLKKLPRLTDDNELSGSQQLALLILSVSALFNTDVHLSTSELLPFLVTKLSAAAVPTDTKLPLLAALRVLSTKLEHVRAVASSGAVRALLALSLHNKTSEAALSVLGDLVAASAAGRKALEEAETAPRALVEAVTRHDSPRGQEHAAYLVMALAHGSRATREAMRELGVVQALLEVTLLGTPLAQRRAAKVLQWFKDDGRISRPRAHSGPRLEGGGGTGSANDGREAEGCCRDAVEKIVKQSLDRNLKSILRRATASVDMTNVKMLVASSSSKSLPC